MNDYLDGSRAGEWLPYVQAARNEVEQNLEAMLGSTGALHYIVLRPIRAGEELLVWYAESMADKLKVPPIRNEYITGMLFIF